MSKTELMEFFRKEITDKLSKDLLVLPCTDCLASVDRCQPCQKEDKVQSGIKVIVNDIMPSISDKLDEVFEEKRLYETFWAVHTGNINIGGGCDGQRSQPEGETYCTRG